MLLARASVREKELAIRPPWAGRYASLIRQLLQWDACSPGEAFRRW
jgi:hypothetical protein